MRRGFTKKPTVKQPDYKIKNTGKGQWRNKYGTGKRTKGKKSSFM